MVVNGTHQSRPVLVLQETTNTGDEGWKTKVLNWSKWRAIVEAVKSDLDSNTREGEECVQVDFVIIYFTLMPKLLRLMLLPACCLLTHFFLKKWK